MKGKVVSITIVLLFLLWTSALRTMISGGTESESIWNVAYGGFNHDVARSVQKTGDGGYIVAGWTMSFGAGLTDFWLIKVDSNGTMQWNQTFGGIANDQAYSVQQTSDEGYIIVGSTESYGAGLSDFWLVKTDAEGVTQWGKTYGGIYDDVAFCVRQTIDGGYIITGYTDSFGAGFSDFWLVKTDTNGTMQWSQTFGGTGFDRASSVVQTSDGGYMIVGETDSFGAGNFDFWLVGTDSVGTTLWSRTYGGASYDVARSVEQTIDGGYIIGGWTNSFGTGGSDFWLIKTDGFGSQHWNKTYGWIFDEEAYSVQQTSDEGYIIVGSTQSYGFGGWDFWLVKTDTNGTMQWNQANGGIADDRAYSVQQTSDEGYIVVGSTESFGAGLSDFWLTKLPQKPEKPPPPPPPRLPGDINGDGRVDDFDLILFNEAYGSSPGSPNWNQYADINGDNIVDILDLNILGQNYGQILE